METIIKSLINEIKKNIVNDIENNGVLFKAAIAAYNTYQEEERDGVEYLFDLNNKEDLKCCIDGGMSAKDIHHLYEEYKKNKTPMFFFGVNHYKPVLVDTWKGVNKVITDCLDDVLPCMLAYHDTKGYKELYGICVSDYMKANLLVP